MSTSTTKKRGRAYDGPKSEEVLTAELVELMSSADLPPWRRQWQGEQGEHRNLLSGHAYRGSNPILLELGSMVRGHSLPLWLGFAEAKAKGWGPLKGSKAVRILRPQLNKRDEEQPDGSTETRAWVSFKPVCVFNAADLKGHDDESAAALAEAIAAALGQANQREPAARIAAAEAVLEAWPVETQWIGTRALYSPDLDQIRMPPAEAFESREAMCATWAHEQAHSTGHSSRLKRPMGGTFGSQAYAREELIAELAAVLICYRLQIGCELANHAAYLSNWAELLKEGGPRVLFQVLSQARQAADLIAPEAPAEEA